MSWLWALLFNIKKGKRRVLITNQSGVKTLLFAEDKVECFLTIQFAKIKPFKGIIRWDNFIKLS